MDKDEERIRDEDFWFEDGTVVLVAESVEFRVYQGALADQSLVLGDLFSQGEEEEEEDGDSNVGSSADMKADPKVDSQVDSNANLDAHSNADSDAKPDANSDSGCPTIKLTDSANDLRHILCAFLPNRDPAPYFYENPSFDRALASHRYRYG